MRRSVIKPEHAHERTKSTVRADHFRLVAVARVEADVFTDRGGVAVFIAQTLREAQRVEALLSQRGVDYAVQVELFGYTLLGSARYGAMFYVTNGQAEYCRSTLVAAGLELGVIEEDADSE